jgi:hypothetical protein
VFGSGGIVFAVRGKPVAMLLQSLTRRQIEMFFAPDTSWLLKLFPHPNPSIDWCFASARASIYAACAKLGLVPGQIVCGLGMRLRRNGQWYRRKDAVRPVPLDAFPGATILDFPTSAAARPTRGHMASADWDAPPL